MTKTGRAWLTQGLENTDGGCPFCGQDLEGVPLIAAYRAVFGESYRQLKNGISAMKSQVDSAFGEGAASKVEMFAEQYRNGVEFWSKYAALETTEAPSNAGAAMRAVHFRLTSLLDQKGRCAALTRWISIRRQSQRSQLTQASGRTPPPSMPPLRRQIVPSKQRRLRQAMEMLSRSRQKSSDSKRPRSATAQT